MTGLYMMHQSYRKHGRVLPGLSIHFLKAGVGCVGWKRKPSPYNI
jgi:hypothetical protein